MSDKFGLSLEDEMPPTRVEVEERMAGLRGITDRSVCALATRILYATHNRAGVFRNTRTCCREGFGCAWLYPYGFVPEAGCPRHD